MLTCFYLKYSNIDSKKKLIHNLLEKVGSLYPLSMTTKEMKYILCI